ncbi:MAG: hypothetical protein JWM59_4240 [Verrucomicrobiales bacterium]|nr:hypothetical protein [Verrucomicrobiales bacterium]
MPVFHRLLCFLLPAAFLTGPVAAAGESSAPAKPVAGPDWDALRADTVQKSFQLLLRSPADPGALSQEALNRAALRGILEHGQTGASVVLLDTAGWETTLPGTPLCAALSQTSVYVRPGRLIPDHITVIRRFLTDQPPEIKTLVLDLRAPSPPQPLAPAAELTGLLVPENTRLFDIPSSGGKVSFSAHGPRCWYRRLWLLVDGDTPNDLELAALILSRQPDVRTIGSPTAGKAVEFAEIPLGTGHVLRVPGTSPVLADGTQAAGQSVKPSFGIGPDAALKQPLMALTDPAGLLPALRETDRPHLNEAALMAGTDPELPGRLAAPPPPAVLPDPVLQQTQDMLETAAFLRLDPEEAPKAPTAADQSLPPSPGAASASEPVPPAPSSAAETPEKPDALK